MKTSGASGAISAVSQTRPRSGAASAPVTSPSKCSTTWSMPAAIRSPLSRVRWTSTMRRSCTSCSSATSGARQRGGRARVGGLWSLRARWRRARTGRRRAPAAVDRLDLEADRGDRALDEGDDAGRLELDLAPARRAPADLAPQLARAQVERARVGEQLAVADVERLVVDQQPDELAVGGVDDGLAVLRIPVARLGVRQRAGLVEAVEVGAGQAERLALVEVAAQADVAVGEREDRLGLGEDVER